MQPGSSRTDASALARIAARNSSRRTGSICRWTIRLNTRSRSGREDDDAVVVGPQLVTGGEGRAAEGDRYVAFARAGLGALARVGPERLDPERQAGQGRGVADGTVHHEAGPAGVHPALRGDVTPPG